MERNRVYVGNLPADATCAELANELSRFGRVRDVDIKYPRTRGGTTYAFAEYLDFEGAEKAVEECAKIQAFGGALKIEFTGQKRQRTMAPVRDSNRSENKVIITGLPKYTSWQDLKDHMRKAGAVGFATVHEDGVGVVEYRDRESTEEAVSLLNGSTLRTHLDQSAVVSVYLPEQYSGPLPARRRSPSPLMRRRYSPPGGGYRGHAGYSPTRRGHSPGARRAASPYSRRRYSVDSYERRGRRSPPPYHRNGGRPDDRRPRRSPRDRSRSPPPHRMASPPRDRTPPSDRSPPLPRSPRDQTPPSPRDKTDRSPPAEMS